jgi:Fe-S-cluster-containing hydrogenase component 2
MFETSAVVSVNDEACVGCRQCVSVCPADALSMKDMRAVVDEPACVGCFKCVEACAPFDAISVIRDPNPRVLTVRAEERPQPAVDELCRQARLAPDAAVCVCTGTTAAEIAAAVLAGVHEPEQLTLATGVRSKCGMWCLTPTMRLLAAHGVEISRPHNDRRIYPDGCTDVAIWTIPDDVADKYPEYRLRENLAAVQSGQALNSPTPWFPDIQPGPAVEGNPT